LTPFDDPLDVTVPVLVMYKGLSAVPKTTGPVVLLLIVFDIGSASPPGAKFRCEPPLLQDWLRARARTPSSAL
jgi:hypothetical protein